MYYPHTICPISMCYISIYCICCKYMYEQFWHIYPLYIVYTIDSDIWSYLCYALNLYSIWEKEDELFLCYKSIFLS